MSSRSIILTLISLGILFSITGAFIVAYRNIELEYTTYVITIPEYRFETIMPGKYTETKSFNIELAAISQDTIGPVNWVYNVTTLPWRNCTGGRDIGVAFTARLALVYDETPELTLEIWGCRNGTCEQLLLNNLLTDAIIGRRGHKYIGKTKYTIRETILDYDYYNITLMPTPVELVVEEFLLGSQVVCSFQYEVTTPLLLIRGYDFKMYAITVPTSVNTTLLRLGVALSVLGITAVAAALALACIKLKQ